MREDAAAKARRLLAEGRLTVRSITEGIVASMHGDSAKLYRTGWDTGFGWWCDCEARSRCSHIRTLQLVVLEPLRAR